MKVVEVETDDHIWMVRELSVTHHEEFGAQRDYDSAAVVQTLLEMKAQPERNAAQCWLVFDKEDNAVGYAYAVAHRSVFSFRKNADMVMWFVKAEHRGSLAGVALIKAYEAWAKSLDVEWAFTNVEHAEQYDIRTKIMALINRLGYMTRGITAAKRLG